MKIIVVANGKGGVGKTTTAAHLGVNFTKRGFYTVLLDTDPLPMLKCWWDRRKEEEPQLLTVPLEALKDAIEKLRSAGVDYLIIDTPGFIHTNINEVLDMADLVMILSKASPLDLDATQMSLEWIKDCKTPMVFVLNEARKGTRIESEAVLALSQYGKVAPIIHYKNDFIVSMITGNTLEETASPKNPGIAQVDALAKYVLQQLGMQKVKPISRSIPKAVGKGTPGKVVNIAGKRSTKA